MGEVEIEIEVVTRTAATWMTIATNTPTRSTPRMTSLLHGSADEIPHREGAHVVTVVAAPVANAEEESVVPLGAEAVHAEEAMAMSVDAVGAGSTSDACPPSEWQLCFEPLALSRR